ncbi:MAG: hypothetical protein LBH96_02410 [Candidatus Peribacteria bacterium]|jgi:hypothetical protein|nr:hypothetical protein [Candidatus Peribacteria bacterium]
MYRGLASKENSGLWIKKLLGKGHYENFLKAKREQIKEIENNPENKDQLMDDLAKCEVEYLLNNIRGSNPYDKT